MGLLLLILLVILLVGAVPAWPYASTWGYGPSGLLSALLLILLIMLILGVIPWGWDRPVVYRP